VRNAFDGTSGVELRGRQLALYGWDAVAQEVHRLAKAAFDMEVVGYDPSPERMDELQKAGVTPLSSAEGIFNSKYVSLHLSLDERTRSKIGKSFVSNLRDQGVLINASEAGVVNETELLECLKQRQDLSYIATAPMTVGMHACQAAVGDALGKRVIIVGSGDGGQLAETEEGYCAQGEAAVRQIVNFFEMDQVSFQVLPPPVAEEIGTEQSQKETLQSKDKPTQEQEQAAAEAKAAEDAKTASEAEAAKKREAEEKAAAEAATADAAKAAAEAEATRKRDAEERAVLEAKAADEAFAAMEAKVADDAKAAAEVESIKKREAEERAATAAQAADEAKAAAEAEATQKQEAEEGAAAEAKAAEEAKAVAEAEAAKKQEAAERASAEAKAADEAKVSPEARGIVQAEASTSVNVEAKDVSAGASATNGETNGKVPGSAELGSGGRGSGKKNKGRGKNRGNGK